MYEMVGIVNEMCHSSHSELWTPVWIDTKSKQTRCVLHLQPKRLTLSDFKPNLYYSRIGVKFKTTGTVDRIL